MAGIPEELVDEILLRLPVDALLRFRCVSKRWRNLIDSPNIVKSQLNLPNKPQIVMVVAFDYEKLRIYYSELNSAYIENHSPNFKEITLPWLDEIFSKVSDYVGQCNGLLCFFCEYDSTFLVLNPFTGKHIEVPPPDEPQGCWWEAWGFGYDRDSDDYKVVVLEHMGNRWVWWIYSLKCSCWKNKDDFPYIRVHDNGVLVNGALHWIVYHDPGDPPMFIFALNLGNFEYHSVPIPSDYAKSLYHLGVVDGCLYAIYSRYNYDYHRCYELWVMKEYGLEESWTRLSTYDRHSIDTELLFVSSSNSLVQCNFGSFWRKIQKAIGNGFEISDLLVYEPSLVYVRSGV